MPLKNALRCKFRQRDTMIKVIIAGQVTIKGLSDVQKERIKLNLTFDNPQYAQAKRAGRYIGSIDPYVYFWDVTGSNLHVPRGYLNNLLNKHLKDIDYEITDRTICPKIKIKWTGELRDYQELAVADMVKIRYAVLEADTGAGKTVCGVGITALRGVKTLVIVHNKELLQQWIEAFNKFTNIKDVGVIGDGQYNIQDVTIGIINSVNIHKNELKDEFGHVICDECHRSISTMWLAVLKTLKPKYQIGVSATPFRNNKTTQAIFCVVGPKQHKVSSTHLRDSGAVLVPDILRIPTDYWFDFDPGRKGCDYTSMLSELTTDQARTQLVVDLIIQDIKTYKEPVMVVSDRVAHCELIHSKLFDVPEVRSIVLSSQVPSPMRKKLVRQIKDGTANCLIATLNLLGEGFDAPHLSAAFLTTPIKFRGRLIQIIGRVLRPSKGCKPRVYDLRDNRIKVLLGSGRSRDSVYKDKGWE